MSETTSAPAEESIYPPLSETSDNDVREVPAAPPETTGDDGGDSSESSSEPVAPEETEQPEQPDDDELQARNARLARELREQKRRARQLELEAMRLRGERQEQPSEEIEREVQHRASQLAHQQKVNEKSNVIYQEGCKQFGRQEFDQCVQAMNEAFGQLTPVVIDTLVDLDAPAAVIQYLHANPDIADDLALLPPHKIAARLAKESARLSNKRSISRAPPPIRPITQTSSAEPETNLDRMSMDELAKLWDRRDFEKRMGLR